MLNRLARLKVDKTEDYDDTIVKTLEKAGFVIIKDGKALGDDVYIVAKMVEPQESEE